MHRLAFSSSSVNTDEEKGLISGDELNVHYPPGIRHRDDVIIDEKSLGELSQAGGGVVLTFEDIRYTYAPNQGLVATLLRKKQKEMPTTLKDVTGIVLPGQSLAIMGSSGSGKTTLLDVLAGRQKAGKLTGRILVNGNPRDKFYKRLSGYVTQEDCLYERLTVYETFMFYAKMRLSSHYTHEQRVERVERVIEELGLEKVRHSMVGGQAGVRGISGGERKRVSIGCELITGPSLLFLDEPTTGLDSYNSLAVMERITALAKKGRTIVCTIHQPRSTIFHNFDQLMILSHGEVVYLGPAQEAMAYFSSLHFHIRPFINPADFLIDVVIQNQARRAMQIKQQELPESNVKSPAYYIAAKPTSDEEGQVGSSAQRIDENTYSVDLAQAFRTSHLFEEITQSVQSVVQRSSNSKKRYGSKPMKEYAANWFKQLFELIKRNIKNMIRNPLTTKISLVQTVFLALLVGSIFFQIGLNQQSIQDRVGVLYFIITNQAFVMIMSMNLFLSERNNFARERAAGVYRPTAYFVAKNIVDVPYFLLVPLIFGTITYWMCGFQANAATFGVYLLTVVCHSAVSSSMFLFVGSFAPNATIATIIVPVFLILSFLFGGFYLNLDNIPVYYKWIYYISYFRYSFEVLMKDIFTGLVFTCTDAERIPPSMVCPIPNGEAELERLGMGDVHIWYNIAVLVAFIVAYRLLAYVGIHFLYKEKK